MSRGLAQSSVEKWTFDTNKMTMTYYDRGGNVMLVEEIGNSGFVVGERTRYEVPCPSLLDSFRAVLAVKVRSAAPETVARP